jgi:hypothetical protein
MRERILVVGNNVRNVVESAFKAGYEAYALTKFIDADLLLYSNAFYIENESGRWVRKRADELAESLGARIVLSSGYEDLEVKAEVLGCQPKAIKNVVNKLRFYKRLEAAGLPYPEIGSFEGKCLLKPVKGGGGDEIRVFNGSKPGRNFLIQRLIEGLSCSASVIVGKEARVIALNEILVGWNEMGARGFRYCGNVTPFVAEEELKQKLIRLAEEACGLFKLNGSVGVDFVVEKKSMEPYILEINPRFQGSLDSIEWSSDINLFELHMRSLEGKELPESLKFRRFAIRAVSFAESKLEIRKDLAGNPFFADVPLKGSIYEEDQPLVSILASGKNREEVVRRAVERKELFLAMQLG